MLDRLPVELLAEVFSVSRARDVEALGSTCVAMRIMARDPIIWRRLFERDYECLYKRGVCAEPWPHGDRTGDPWPDFAIAPNVDRKEFTARLPPAPTPSWVPPPFARMEAMGKDARWLYIAHSRNVTYRDARIGADPTPATIVLGIGAYGEAASTYRGDVAVGNDGLVAPFGYGAALTLGTHTDVIEYTEGAWRGRRTLGWSVAVGKDSATLTGSACPYGARHRCRVYRAHGGRAWCTLEGDCEHGSQFRMNADGTLNINILSYGESIDVRIVTHDGLTTVRRMDENGRLSRVGEIGYPNGDRMTYSRGRLTSNLAITCFWVSEQCPDPFFAGRVISDAQWEHEYAELNYCYTVSAFWTTGHGESDRLFRNYVRKGLMGWPPAAQAIAMARIQQFSP